MRNTETGGMMPDTPIRIDALTDADKGRGVIFHRQHGVTERGVLSSWNDRFVFCRFTSGSNDRFVFCRFTFGSNDRFVLCRFTSGSTAAACDAACDPERLTFEHRDDTP